MCDTESELDLRGMVLVAVTSNVSDSVSVSGTVLVGDPPLREREVDSVNVLVDET